MALTQPENPITDLSSTAIRVFAAGTGRAALPGVSLDVIRAAFADLHMFGFTNTTGDIFATVTSAQGLQLLGDRVTTFGKSFMSFCTPPQTVAP